MATIAGAGTGGSIKSTGVLSSIKNALTRKVYISPSGKEMNEAQAKAAGVKPGAITSYLSRTAAQIDAEAARKAQLAKQQALSAKYGQKSSPTVVPTSNVPIYPGASGYSASMQQLAKSNYKASGQSYAAPSSNSPISSSSGGGSSGGGLTSRFSSYDDAYNQAYADYQSQQDQYRKALIDSKKGAINAEYETNASIIKNNLTRALAALNQNKAALEPLYQRQLSSIAQNQFSTSETTKEIMNQGGWNASNSGLAVGEQTKIANTADTQRSESLQAKTTAENEYNSQMSTEQMAADESLGALKKWRSAQLSAAEADAFATSTEYGRSIYESDRDFAFTQRQFEESVRQFDVQLAEQRANRTAAQKAAVANATASGYGQQEYNKFVNILNTSSFNGVKLSDSEVFDFMQNAMSDPYVNDSIKKEMVKKYESWWDKKNEVNNNTTSYQDGFFDFSQMDQ